MIVLVSWQGGGMLGEGIFLVWGQVVAVTSYRSQVQFFLVVQQVEDGLCGRYGVGCCGVLANFISFFYLGFFSRYIYTSVGMGPCFGDSHKESNFISTGVLFFMKITTSPYRGVTPEIVHSPCFILLCNF